MKNWCYFLRLGFILISGLLLVKMTNQFKYEISINSFLYFGGVLIIAIYPIWWSIVTDLSDYFAEKNKVSLIPLGLGVVFIGVICIRIVQIYSAFHKPTLLEASHIGNFFTAESIDLKVDGTYIFRRNEVDSSWYIYGDYKIKGNKIILDKNNLDNVLITNQLEIRPGIIEYSDQTEVVDHVYQIDSNGQVLKNEIEFRVVVDNRNN